MIPVLFYAGLLGLIALVLSVRVTLVRNKTKILLGDGGNSELMLAIRRFGNFAEYGPLGLLLLVLVSVQAETWFVDAAGIALVAGRAIHPFGITAKPGLPIPRLIGQSLTWIMIAATSIYLLVLSVG